MLNLIKNEYAKIFHKKTSYIMLAFLLLAVIALPLISKYAHFNPYSSYYYGGYEEEIANAKANNDTVEAEKLEMAQSLDIPHEKYYSNELWITSALDSAYYTYRYEIVNNKELDKKTKDDYQTAFDNIIQYAENNDWKGYFQYQISLINNSDNSSSEKESQTYYYQYMLDHNINPDGDTWQKDCLQTYTNLKYSYDEYMTAIDNGDSYDKDDFEQVNNEMMICKYRLDNDVNSAIYESSLAGQIDSSEIYTYSDDFYNTMKYGVSLCTVILLIILTVAGGIIAREFSQGTIKFLLINPVKRNKIFWSKYITLFTYTFLLVTATFLLEFIMCTIVYGPSQIGTQLLTVSNNHVVASSGFLFMFGRYMLVFAEIIIAMTIAFMISSLAKNTALAIALSLIIYYVGSTVSLVASQFSIDFIRYTIFANQGITSIANRQTAFSHMTPQFSFAVIGVHMILLLFVAHDAFTRKNV